MRSRALAAVVTVSGLLLAGCGGGDEYRAADLLTCTLLQEAVVAAPIDAVHAGSEVYPAAKRAGSMAPAYEAMGKSYRQTAKYVRELSMTASADAVRAAGAALAARYDRVGAVFATGVHPDDSGDADEAKGLDDVCTVITGTTEAVDAT